MNDHDVVRGELSAAGATRREAMLGELQRSMRDLHGRRRRRRTVIASTLTIAAMAGLAVFARPTRPTRSPAPVAPVVVDIEQIAPAVDPPVMIVEFVETRSGVLDRYAARGTGLTEIIDDAALVTALATIDRPTGIVRRGGEVWLTADVTDEL